MRRPLFILACLALTAQLLAAETPPAANNPTIHQSINPPPMPPPPVREFRAAWVATVANKDWPSQPGLPVAQQQAELISLLDRAAQLHFNAIFFQVRSVSDAMYPSAIEPWSEYLTGVQGRAPAPYYDPLAFAITEAHQRGLALHAWFNPFRAGHPQSKSPPAANHVTRLLPELVRHYCDQTLLDPGEPAAQARIEAVMLDVVRRYDVDGILMDDYFYPYPQKNASGKWVDFPDDACWKEYGLASGLSRADWRRENINHFVHKLSQSVKAAKPWVQFGISPFGIWRPQNPPSITGMDAYDAIYADSRKWLAEGWVDYLSPQLYWSVASPGQGFSALYDWWRAQNVQGRHVWPALADYSVGTKFSPAEISLQLQIIRKKTDPGAAHFHLRRVLDTPALAAALRTQYAQPALIPISPWIHSSSPPPAPAGLSVSPSGKRVHVQWQSPSATPSVWLVQARAKGAWSTQIIPGPQLEGYLYTNPDAVALRSVDRLGNLSSPIIWTAKIYTTPRGK